jgi:hypothetical protein
MKNNLLAQELHQKVREAFGTKYQEESDLVSKELLGESPRASVIVGTAWLDNYINELLLLVLPKDNKIREVFIKPRRTFGQRVETAYNLRIISKSEKEGMELIKNIRNKFAHKISASFTDKDIIELAVRVKKYIYIKYEPDKIPEDRLQSDFIQLLALYVASFHLRIQSFRDMKDQEIGLQYLRFCANKSEELLK